MLTSTQQSLRFSPQDLPGLQLWLDGADSNTITMTGSNVSAWVDKGKHAYTMNAAPTGCSLPIRGSNVNGLSTVGINTASTGIKQTTVLDGMTNIFMVRKERSGNQGYMFWFGADSAVDFHTGDQNQFAHGAISPAGVRDASMTMFTSNAVTSGTLRNIVMPGANVLNLVSISNLTGSTKMQGVSYDRGNTFRSATCDWCEILTYSNALSRVQIEAVEGYLAQKWGIQSYLPVSHMFRTGIRPMRPLTPIDIPSCAIWIDPADSTSYTLSGANVTQIRDKRGLLTFNPGTAATVTTTGVPGFVYTSNVTYSATADISVSAFTTNRADFTYMIVATHTTSNNLVNTLPMAIGVTGFRLSPFFSYGNASNVLSFIDAASQGFPRLSVGSVIPSGRPSLVIYRRNNKTVDCRVNGLTASNRTFSDADAVLFSDCNYRANLNVVGARWWGTLHEIVHYNRALTDTELVSMEGYFARKWSLRGSLPSTHGFKRSLSLVPSFIPRLVSNCALWIDPIDRSTLRLSNTSDVSSIQDKSTSERTLIRYTEPAVSPTFTTTSRAEGIRFQGSYQVLQLPFAVFNDTSSFAFMMMARFGTLSQYLLGKQADFVNSYQVLGLGLSNNGVGTPGTLYYRTENGSAQADSGTTPLASNTPYLITAYTLDGATFRFRINGSLWASTTSSNGAFTMPNIDTDANNYIGNWMSRDYFAGSSNDWTLHEFVFLKSGVTLTGIEQMEGYLAWKWGRQTDLSAGHPYRALNPI